MSRNKMSFELTKPIRPTGKEGRSESTVVIGIDDIDGQEKVISEENGQVNIGFTEIPDTEQQNNTHIPRVWDALDNEPDEKESDSKICSEKLKPYLHIGFYVLLVILYFVYFSWAMYYGQGDGPSIFLIIVTLFVGFIIALHFTNKYFKLNEKVPQKIHEKLLTSEGKKLRLFTKWFMICGALAIIIWIIVEVALRQPYNLISLAGIIFYLVLFYIFSTGRKQINWSTIFWGLIIQLIMAIFILRTHAGYRAFDFLGGQVSDFLTHSDAGAKFVFGNSFEDHMMAFKIFPMIVFFSAIMSMLYHLGVMQAVILVLGRGISFCMGTSPTESITAASNIFVGMTESPLLIKPYINDMTDSELHAVMTGGFATISGSLLGLYSSYGAKPQHLISASVMSAPAALALSKLLYPELEDTKSTEKDYGKIGASSDGNILDAAAKGASLSIKLVANIAVNLIAFLAILSFVNAVLVWLGDRVLIENLTFEKICSYILFPVAFLMGIAKEDCMQVAEMIGIKTFLNEMIAFSKLHDFVQNRITFDNYTNYYNSSDSWSYSGNDIFLHNENITLKGGIMQERSEVISTYALCGFANIGSIGIVLGSMAVLAPNKSKIISKNVARAMIAGNVACFVTACIASLLIFDQ
ncbi:solute carrier family 28 member 3-like [Argonauta hians]